MNSPVAPSAVQTSELPLARIVHSGTHIQELRRARYDQASLKELANSIAEVGVLQAVVVRPDPNTASEFYELVAGERRWLAAKIAGLATIPVSIRALTDEQVLKAQLVENLQREGLHPLEEAEGYDELMKLEKVTADQVATMIGKSRSYVFGRLKLLGLDLEGRKAFYNGDIDASRALYVARIATPKLKARALELAMEKTYKGEFMFSARELQKQLTSGQFSVDLRKAPFALSDVSFFEEVKVKKGVTDKRPLPDCVTCPNRTGNCLDLFNQDDSPDVCMEPACYAIKVRQNTERLREVATAGGATIITGDAAKKIMPRKEEFNGYIDLDDVCDDDELPDPQPSYPRKTKDQSAIAAYDKAMEEWDRKSEAYKSRTFRQLLDGQALPTVLLEDPKDKRLRTLVPLKDAKQALAKVGIKLSDWRYKAQPQQRHQYQAPVESATDKQKRLEEEERQRAREQKEMQFRREVMTLIFAKWSGPLKRDDLEAIAEEQLDNNYQARDTLKFLYDGKVPQPGQMKEAELTRLLAILNVWQCLQWSSESPKAMLDLARRLKIDPDKVKQALKQEAKASAAAPAKKAGKKAKAAA
ncbi:MAG TPA: ParB/RepB/Spo0J family partition protein [Burkholderiales bacterium]|nr:ParB/RepB/Spo0J family partition protein [Burkholderiales bacterium]